MHLLISTLLALVGSLVGSAVRGGVTVAQSQVSGDDGGASVASIKVSVSPVAGLIGGVAGTVLGLRAAFWVGSVLGAAGMDRVDARLLAQVGIDLDAVVAKAVEKASVAGETVINQADEAADDESA